MPRGDDVRGDLRVGPDLDLDAARREVALRRRLRRRRLRRDDDGAALAVRTAAVPLHGVVPVRAQQVQLQGRKRTGLSSSCDRFQRSNDESLVYLISIY